MRREQAGLRAGERVVLMNETAFVLGGDIILSVNGREVSTASDIARILLESRPGEILRVAVSRDGMAQEVILQLGEMHR